MIEISSVKIVVGWLLLMWVVSNMGKTIAEFIPDNKIIYNAFKILLMCGKCVTFWVTLIFTFDPFIAAMYAFLMYIIEILENKINYNV